MSIFTRFFVVASLVAGAVVSTLAYSEGYGGHKIVTAESLREARVKPIKDDAPLTMAGTLPDQH